MKFSIMKNTMKSRISVVFAISMLVGVAVAQQGVTKPQNAMDCVAKGLSRINAFLPARAKVAGKNVTADLSRYYEASKKEKAE